MKKFKILSYIKRFRILIALFSLCAGILFIMYARRSQTYTANTVISFANGSAKYGNGPDGSPIDISEITSAKVMTEVFNELGLEYKGNSFDDIRSRITVASFVSSEASEIQAALNKQGEAYDELPTDYRVSFTATAEEGEEFARLILDTLLEKYLIYYSENHVNQQILTNSTDDIMSSNYDYVEMMELLDNSITTTKDALMKKYDADYSFRSTTNGYTFYDLYCEFDYLDKVKVSDIFAKIFDNQITKDKDVLISKYQQRMSDYGLNNNKDDTEVQKVLDIISSYVDMMKRSGNTEIGNEYILDSVYNTYNEANPNNYVDRTVEYEVLLNNYVTNRESFEHDVIDTAYCEYIISVFTEAKEEFVPYATADSVSSDINALVTRMNELYRLANEANADYNEYLGAVNIVALTSTDVAQGINVKLYLIVGIVLFLIIGCLGAIVLGRLLEMIEYAVYVDKSSGLANKSKCDSYMDDYRNKYVSMNHVCIAMTVIGQLAQNGVSARLADDDLVRTVGGILADVFPQDDDTFLGYMGSGLFVVFNKAMNVRKAEYQMALMESRIQAFNQDHEQNISISYSISESSRDRVYTVRDLFQKAVQGLYSE